MHSSQSGSSPSLLPHHASWIDVVDVQTRSPLAVNGALHALDAKEVEVPSMSHTILDMDSEWLLQFSSIV
jgi:hypothetical protein